MNSVRAARPLQFVEFKRFCFHNFGCKHLFKGLAGRQIIVYEKDWKCDLSYAQ